MRVILTIFLIASLVLFSSVALAILQVQDPLL